MQNLGRYQIIEQIGAGAMGAVYKARDPMMDRDVAIKTILTHAIEGPQSDEFRQRFFREAQAAGRLAHPGIVTVYDVSEHEGTPFLVMEFVPGRTLLSILQDGERTDNDRVYDLGIQICEALNYAHRHRVIHRDIKPANILITPDGRAKIADFGVARLAESQVTSTGQFLGTPAFMAPEQFTGAPIDGRADLFAAGVVLYWMATGDKPFTGDSIIAVQYKVVNTDPVPPRKLNPAIPRDLETVIVKSIAKDPAERYQSGEELAFDLRALRAGQPIAAKGKAGTSDSGTVILTNTPAAEKTVVLTAATSRLSNPPLHRAAAPKPVLPSAGKSKRRSRPLLAAGAAVILALGAFGITRVLKPKPAPPQAAVAVAVRSKPEPAPAPAPPAQPQASTPTQPLQQGKKEENESPGPVSAPVKTRAAAPVPPPPRVVEAPNEETINLQLSAQLRTNVVFQTDGAPTETLFMKSGDSSTLRAQKEATVTISNVAGLDAKLNGKPLSFGERGAGRWVITPEGIDTSRSVTSARNLPGTTDAETPAGDIAPGRGNRNALASETRQKQLANSPSSVRLLIRSPAIAEFLTVIVRMDNQLLFRRDSTAPPPENLRDAFGRLQFPPGLSAVPLAEERLIPAGSHKLQVVLLAGNDRIGQPQEVSEDFTTGQRRTLTIRFNRNVPRGERGQSRLNVTLEP